MQTVTYTYPSYPVIYKEQLLDSWLELKFILMIEHTQAWLRQGLEIYYNINDTPEGFHSHIRKYTPDFLIRNHETGKARLVEIKPDPYDDRVALHKREKIANNFILEMGYDWEYQLIRESDIHLLYDQQRQFERLISRETSLPRFISGDLLQNDSGHSDASYIQFVKTGCWPSFVP